MWPLLVWPDLGSGILGCSASSMKNSGQAAEPLAILIQFILLGLSRPLGAGELGG